MSAITFDTLKFAQRLERAGLPTQQASAFAEAQREVLSEVLDTQVATKSDIADVKTDIANVKTDIADAKADIATDIADVKADMKLVEQRLQHQINLIKWMLGLVIVVEVLPYLKALLG